jgi:hypothetical protein
VSKNPIRSSRVSRLVVASDNVYPRRMSAADGWVRSRGRRRAVAHHRGEVTRAEPAPDAPPRPLVTQGPRSGIPRGVPASLNDALHLMIAHGRGGGTWDSLI